MQKTFLVMSIAAVAVFAMSQGTIAFAGDGGSCAKSCSSSSAKAAEGGSQCPFLKALASLSVEKSKADQGTAEQPASEEARQVASYENALGAYQNVAAGTEDEAEDKEAAAGEGEKKEGCAAKAEKACDKEGDSKSCEKQEAKAGCCAASKSCPDK